jgi:Spy/CpxP family protein refolding chaperone
MRRIPAALAMALLLTACSSDTTAPDRDGAARLDEMAAFAWGATQVGDPGNRFMTRLAQLPPDLALSAAQAAQINALVADFVVATAADREALADVLAEARAAREAGRTQEEVRAILAAGAPVRARLQEAERGLHQSVMGVLTPAQRAWLTGRTPREPGPCSTITAEQRTEISGLFAAFEQDHAADLATVRSARERALAARESGASREQVAAILAEARAAMQRLMTARAALHDAVNAVLTPEQRAAGCFR